MTLDVELISFDLDNTLYDYENVYRIAINEVFKLIIAEYPKLDLEQLNSTYQYLKLQAEKLAFRENKSSLEYRKERLSSLLMKFDIDQPDLLDKVVEVYSDNFEKNLRSFPGVKDVLEYLFDRYNGCLISEGPADMQDKTLKIFGLKKYFKFEFYSSETGLIKKDGSLFEFALKTIGVKPEQVVHIGDSQARDINGAKLVGMKVIWLNPSGQSLQTDIPKPDFQITSLSELFEIF
jgi:putative hydrolase of the HAD superfamily